MMKNLLMTRSARTRIGKRKRTVENAKIWKKAVDREMFLQHFIVILICVVFPGATTMYFPATWISLERSGADVHCTTRTCVYFVVPFKTQRVEKVTEIKQHEKAGENKQQMKQGRTTGSYVHVDGQGFVEILGKEQQKAEVSVTPASLEKVVERLKHFLEANEETNTIIFAIANWKFGGIMGGVLTMFTLLFVVGYSASFVKLLFRFFKRLLQPTSMGST